jgi:acetyltransferase-like isoleucine patch superfamily enzyme
MASNKPRILEIDIVDVQFGEDVTVVKPVNLYGCSIGDNSFIGPFVEIQKGASIGDRTRIQSHCFICDLVTIGNDTFIGHGVMFINDWFETGRPAFGRPDLWSETLVGNNVSIGSNATILPVTICDDVVIGAGSVVTRDIVESGVYLGSPAKKVRTLDDHVPAAKMATK